MHTLCIQCLIKATCILQATFKNFRDKLKKPYPSTSPEFKNYMSDPNVQNMRSRGFHHRDDGNVKNNLNNNLNNRFRINAEDDQLANYQKVPAGKIGSELRISK